MSGALQSNGMLHVLFRRAFPQTRLNQCMLTQCTNVQNQFVECDTVSLTDFESDLCGDIGPDSVALLPDDSLVVFFRNSSRMQVGVCPPLPAPCSGFVSRPVDVDAALPQGVQSQAAGVWRGLPVLAYSAGASELRLIFCGDARCVGPPGRVERVALAAQGLAFAADGAGALLLVAVANEQGLWLLNCSGAPQRPCLVPALLSNASDWAQETVQG